MLASSAGSLLGNTNAEKRSTPGAKALSPDGKSEEANRNSCHLAAHAGCACSPGDEGYRGELLGYAEHLPARSDRVWGQPGAGADDVGERACNSGESTASEQTFEDLQAGAGPSSPGRKHQSEDRTTPRSVKALVDTTMSRLRKHGGFLVSVPRALEHLLVLHCKVGCSAVQDR